MDAPTRLSNWPWVEIRVDCSMCDRAGCYRLARLAMQFGSEMHMHKLLAILARDCPYWRNDARKYEVRCGARFKDMDVQAPKMKRPEREQRVVHTGRPPTIGDSRRHGIVAFFIDCAGLHCHRRTRVTFDEIGLPDDTVFIEIPRVRRFRCQRCGSRTVTVAGDWPDTMEAHARKVRGEDPSTTACNIVSGDVCKG